MESNDLLNKLERVERAISVYRNNDEKLIEEIDIDIPVEKLRTMVIPRDGDELLYMGYVLDEDQLKLFNAELGNIIKPDFSLYYYVLECHGIYNW